MMAYRPETANSTGVPGASATWSAETVEAAYQWSGFLPFSTDDGYENGLDAAYLAVSAMF